MATLSRLTRRVTATENGLLAFCYVNVPEALAVLIDVDEFSQILLNSAAHHVLYRRAFRCVALEAFIY